MKIKNRLRGVKGSCYLTHGSDNYDHHGLKKALRAEGRDLIREALEESTEPTTTPTPTSYRLVITTQIYENYGYRWKPKGGSEYHLPIADITAVTGKALADLVQSHRHLIERTGSDDALHSSSEHIINWQIVPNTELTDEEEMEADPWMAISDEAKAHYRNQRETAWRQPA